MKKLNYLLIIFLVIEIPSCTDKGNKTPDNIPKDTRVKDIDGNIYDTIKIGTQVWMKQNLKTTHYNDGTTIPTGNIAWQSTTSGAYVVYNNDNTNNATYGKLYNWHAVNSGKLAPKGWHVASEAEWLTLINYLGGQYTACSVMLSGNDNNFTVKLGGELYQDGLFYGVGTNGYFWTTTETTTLYSRYITLCSCGINVVSCYGSKTDGFSVRCIRN